MNIAAIAAQYGITERQVRNYLKLIGAAHPCAELKIEGSRVDLTAFAVQEIAEIRAIGPTAYARRYQEPQAPQPIEQAPQAPQAATQAPAQPRTPTYTLVPVNSALASAEPPLLPVYHIPTVASQIEGFDQTQQIWLEQAARLTGVADTALSHATAMLSDVRARSRGQVAATEQAVQATRLKLAAVKAQATLTQESLIADQIYRTEGLTVGESLQGQLDATLASLGFQAVSE